jgi:PIN domain nuclease of toxin-antitoxin system
MQAYLDTQVAVRLAAGDVKKLSRAAKLAIERYDLLVSPMVRVELEYLHELGRCGADATSTLAFLQEKCGLAVCPMPFDDVARAACRETWTRDAFDRVIVAQARAAGDAYLITSDEHIRAHYPKAIW